MIGTFRSKPFSNHTPLLAQVDTAAGWSICERDDRPERPVGSGEIALELQRLTLRAFQQIDQVHVLGSILRSEKPRQASELAAVVQALGLAATSHQIMTALLKQ